MIDAREIRDIPIERIDILNPRVRNQKIFRELVASIECLGLKKPITVTPRGTGDEERFALVCGQGRIEAFRALGQTSIPALVIEATDEDAFVMSLVENIARRNPHAAEQLESIGMLQQRGYDVATIARKTALDPTWVRGILLLLGKGEVRLIQAVEAGIVPLAIAIAIVRADANGSGDDGAVQAVLQQAYENGDLRGSKMMTVRRLIEQRRNLGKGYERRGPSRSGHKLSSVAMVRAYNQEVERQKLLIRKADLVQQHLTFMGAAMARTRAGSKQAKLIEMLKRPDGATIPEVVDALEWQAHTVRGAIAGALKKKLGIEVTSEKVDGRGRVYRVAS